MSEHGTPDGRRNKPAPAKEYPTTPARDPRHGSNADPVAAVQSTEPPSTPATCDPRHRTYKAPAVPSEPTSPDTNAPKLDAYFEEAGA